MKVALVHDYLKEFGGAESVLESLSDLYPDAPIYTALFVPSALGPHRLRLVKKWRGRIHQSFFRFIPFASFLISPLRLLSPLAFYSFNFSGFDLIISSATGAYFPNALNKRGAKLVCYCHTPPRYLYGLPTARNFTKNPVIRAFVAIFNHLYRLLDFRFSQNVDQYIANSYTTAGRIRKYYRRSSVVINPPVDTVQISHLSLPRRSKNIYYLAGGRFARAKRLDLAILACNQLKLPVKIFGRDFANIESELRSIAGPTIEFIGEVTQEEKFVLYKNSIAFIFPSDNEDFGIMPVEAMSQGCPVIAYGVGGAAETVLDGQTGVLFHHLTRESCVQAIKRFQSLTINPKACISRASLFSPQIFRNKIKKLTSSVSFSSAIPIKPLQIFY